jgi:UDP-galactopyranose mutase
VVGAGFAGSVIARQLAEAGADVLVIDKRSHIAGNAYDSNDDAGILVHLYGPHIFHTNSQKVFEYLSKFTEWRFYEHRVRSVVNGTEYPFPINRDTVNQLYGLQLSEQDIADYFEKVKVPFENPRTSEELVLNSVGKDLYEKFFLNYTIKQWGLHPSELKAGVAARIPVRTNSDDRYFADTYQVMPLHGYTNMFENMLAHQNIHIQLNTDFLKIRKNYKDFHIVFTGPIDAYYDYCHGRLPYRSLSFEHGHIATQSTFQSVGTVNYPNDHAFTRITEFKHLTGQTHAGTSIVKEYPTAEGDPYYPIPTENNEKMYKLYEALSKKDENITFVGRLAQYKYYNMDQVVAAALVTADNIINKLKS